MKTWTSTQFTRSPFICSTHTHTHAHTQHFSVDLSFSISDSVRQTVMMLSLSHQERSWNARRHRRRIDIYQSHNVCVPWYRFLYVFVLQFVVWSKHHNAQHLFGSRRFFGRIVLHWLNVLVPKQFPMFKINVIIIFPNTIYIYTEHILYTTF